MFRSAMAAAITVCGLAHTAAGQVSIVEQAGITFPVDAELKGVEGCCRIAFELQPDGSKRIDDVHCTSSVFEESAVDVVIRSRISGPPSSRARIPIKFAYAGSVSGSCASPDTWNGFVEDAASAFPWEAADFDSDHDYQVARAKGIAALRVDLDVEGSCGVEPYLQPADIGHLAAIDSLSTLRASETSLLGRQGWLACRERTLDNYQAEATDTAARYSQIATTDFRFWVPQYMSSNVTRIRGELDREAADLGRFEAALDTAISRAENIARIRAGRRRRSRQDNQRDRSKADAFFASRGPGQYEACLATAYTYSARQTCLNDWIGGSAGRGRQPILDRTVYDRTDPVTRETSVPAPDSGPVQSPSTCPPGYSCNCGPEPVPAYQGGSCR